MYSKYQRNEYVAAVCVDVRRSRGFRGADVGYGRGSMGMSSGMGLGAGGLGMAGSMGLGAFDDLSAGQCMCSFAIVTLMHIK